MGNLLRLLSRDDTPKYDVFVDFENAQPTQMEEETYQIVNDVLQHSKRILFELQLYQGAGNAIREFSKLREFYEFSQKLEAIVPRILWELSSGPLTPTEHLKMQQALVKQFAEMLDFVLTFDDLKQFKMIFSYYRRTVNRLRLANQDPSDDELEIPNELANRMSLFYAHATPMLKVLSDATTRFVSENKDLPIENTTETLGTMAKICQRMIENSEFCSRFHREDTILFVLRVMVGLIILYDHVHPVGAFSRNAHIDVKGCIKVLKDQPTNVVEGLLNAFK
ncbi:CYFIP-related Rac1 interactor B, partial [Caerostris extrusa]